MGVNGVNNSPDALSSGNNTPCPVFTDHIWAQGFISEGTVGCLGNAEVS
jgi:hypothetical protein